MTRSNRAGGQRGPTSRSASEAAADGDANLARLRHICLALPETSESPSWGHPNFKAGGKVFVARRNFFATPYGRGLWASMRMAGRVDWSLVKRLVARKRMIVALEAMAGGDPSKRTGADPGSSGANSRSRAGTGARRKARR